MENSDSSKLYDAADKQIMKQAEDSLDPRIDRAPMTPLLVKERKLNHHTLEFFKEINLNFQKNE
jgi:hypothetical protein